MNKHSSLLFLFLLSFLLSHSIYAQCIGPVNDCDNDGLLNSIDLDDDNDGVLDTNEGSVFDSYTLEFSQFPNHVSDEPTVALIFDGLTIYTGNQDLRFHDFVITPGDLNGSILDNALVIGAKDGSSNVNVSAGTLFRLYMENDDALGEDAGDIAADIVSGSADLGLNPNDLFDIPFVDITPVDGIHDNYDGFNSLFLDRTGDGLTGDDFSRDGDADIDTEGVDFSPMGAILQFYQGIPGASGVVVDTFFTPIQLLDDGTDSGYASPAPGSDGVITYDATTNISNFSHIVVASITDGTGLDIRVIEMEANLIANIGGGSIPVLTFLSTLDTDGDGSPDHLDLDSDGDGCSDAFESGAVTNLGFNYQFPDVDANSDGFVDAVDDGSNGGTINDGIPDYTATLAQVIDGIGACPVIDSCDAIPSGNTDTDGDGVSDVCDLDDDNDGVLDTDELGTTVVCPVQQISSIGTDLVIDNGTAADLFDLNLANVFYFTNNQNFTVQRDIFTINFSEAVTLTQIDIILDRTISFLENGVQFQVQGFNGTGYDNLTPLITSNGIAESNRELINLTNTTAYQTYRMRWISGGQVGWEPYIQEIQYTANTCNAPIVVETDTDSDGTPDYLDLDSDNDGCSDAIEAGTTTNQTANYQFPSNDVDIDGIPNTAIASNATGDFQNAAIFSCDCPHASGIDTDGDGVDDACDFDDDNDGILDCVENGLDTTFFSLFNPAGNAIQVGEDVIQLTDDLLSESGIINSFGKVNFSSSFTFEFEANLGSNNGGADGIAIVFHNDPAGINTLGAEGSGIGARGIVDGIVLEIDTFDNSSNLAATGDIANDHGMIWDSDNQLGPGGILTTAISLGDIEDGAYHDVVVMWDSVSQTLSYTIGGTVAGSFTNDIVTNYLGGINTATLAYSASTGGSTNTHLLRAIDLCGLPIFLDTDNDGTPDYLDLDSDNDSCPDALEGDGSFEFTDLDGSDMLSGGINSGGVPTISGSPQGMGDSKDDTVYGCPITVDFDGVNDHLMTSNLDLSNWSALTLQFWVKANSALQADAGIVGQKGIIEITQNGKLECDIFNQGGEGTFSNALWLDNSNTWQHITLVYNSGLIQLYYNGIKQYEQTSSVGTTLDLVLKA
ncbi:lectin-like domain-containing protein [Lacinutrix jangbogonensis]|uniref:lectin-like domain-containing protein n=1 Tax=Lacinutrix jangbogonensis TaxID=1469557 RepID=UPI00053DDFEA|nr:LamG-like jellyroll fold domain-containing protein [Lacinutrix jangbogonensis]